jgi:hypothetical protein
MLRKEKFALIVQTYDVRRTIVLANAKSAIARAAVRIAASVDRKKLWPQPMRLLVNVVPPAAVVAQSNKIVSRMKNSKTPCFCPSPHAGEGNFF